MSNSSPAATSARSLILSPTGRTIAPKRYAYAPVGMELPIEDQLTWQPATGAIPLPADATQTLVLDFGQKLTGHLELYLEGASRVSLELISGPVPALTRFRAKLAVEASDRGWRDAYRAFRYARFCWDQPPVAGVTLRANLLFTAYPVQYRGNFDSDSAVHNRIWHAAAYTVQLCIQPHELSGAYIDKLPPEFSDFVRDWKSPYGQYVIWDGPRRDREVWIGDMWPEALTTLYAFGAPETVRSSLALVTCIQNEDGSIPGSGLTKQPFAEYACWWVMLLERFYQITGDASFLRDMEGPFRKQMAWLRARLSENDGWLMIGKRQTWAWTLMRSGVVTGSQCVAFAALRGATQIFRLLGDNDAAFECHRLAGLLRDKIRTELWNEDLGVFKDSLTPPDGIPRFSCDSNALAMLFRVATPRQAARTREFLRKNLWGPFGTRTIDPPEPLEGWNWAHNHNVWPFVVGLELEARYEWEDFAGADDLLRRCWGNMIHHNTECFWEMVDGRDGSFITHRPVADTGIDADTWDSYSHGWSGGVAYMLQAYVLGVRPLAPGLSRFLVAPRRGSLGTIAGTVPTPHGPIHVNADRDHVAIDVPAGTEAFYAPESGLSTEARLLPPGRHVLRIDP
jgi:hypothetical protein